MKDIIMQKNCPGLTKLDLSLSQNFIRHNLFQAKDYDIELPPWCGIQILPFGGHEGSRFGRFDLARRPRLGRQEVNHLRISL